MHNRSFLLYAIHCGHNITFNLQSIVMTLCRLNDVMLCIVSRHVNHGTTYSAAKFGGNRHGRIFAVILCLLIDLLEIHLHAKSIPQISIFTLNSGQILSGKTLGFPFSGTQSQYITLLLYQGGLLVACLSIDTSIDLIKKL